MGDFRGHTETSNVPPRPDIPLIIEVNEKDILVSPYRAVNRSGRPKGKKISQYTLGGELVATYPSGKTAADKTGLKGLQIRRCARGEILSYGDFLWKYNKVERVY